jgi:RNA polymerase I-specific transcription initiation factor RRN6
MDEHPDSALHYGHVGRAVYLPEEQAWTFARSFTRCECLLKSY